MFPLYIISNAPFSGKSAMCVALGNKFKEDALTIGYIKPVSPTGKQFKGVMADEDAHFMKQVFSLPEPLSALSPIVLTAELRSAVMAGEETIDWAATVKEAFEQVSASKDVVLIEGAASLDEGAIVNLSMQEVTRLLNPKVLLMVRYTADLSLEAPLLIKNMIGEALIGMVFNAVPADRLEMIETEAKPYMEKQGIKVFAVLPQERVLMSTSVAELAESLDGQILNSPEQSEALVENLMVGAMGVDSALDYFRRKDNKAVITGGDRPDIQLAALQTSTRCLILTGNLPPNPLIMAQAEDREVPMILVKSDTLTTVEMIERVFGKSRFHQDKKIAQFQKLLEERFDYSALYASLNLTRAVGQA